MILESEDLDKAVENLVKSIEFVECESWSVDYAAKNDRMAKPKVNIRAKGLFKGAINFEMSFEIGQEELQTWAMMSKQVGTS